MRSSSNPCSLPASRLQNRRELLKSRKVALFIMRKPAILIASVLALALLSGCKSKETSCKQSNKDYVGAKELPPLKAPRR